MWCSLSAGELDALALASAELVALGALVCMTDGPSGVELLGSGASPVKVPAMVVEEVDATGAGDTFAAAFLTALVSGADPEDAARAASAVAAHSVTVLGAMEASVECYAHHR